MAADKKPGRLRWRKKSLRGLWDPPKTHEFTDGVTVHATVTNLRSGGWYWYGMGRNTSNAPSSTVEDAKQQAEKYVRTALGVTPTGEKQ